MENKRLKFIDMAKGIGIILVLFGHLIYTNEYVRVWISAFHMPVFFVLSGITLYRSNGNEQDSAARIRKKARSLLIPYLWFSAVFFIVDIGNVYLGKITMHDFIMNAISSVTLSGKSVLWFLTTLFFSQVIIILMQSKFNDRFVIMLIILFAAAGCAAAPFVRDGYIIYADSYPVTALLNIAKDIARALVVTPFTAIGYYGRKYYDRYRSIADKPVIRAVSSVVLLILCIVVSRINWAVDTNNIILNSPLLYYAGGITGSLSVICICSVIPSIRPLEVIGRYSLVIMAIHLDLYVLWAGLQVGEIFYAMTGYTQVLTIVTVICTLIMGSIAGYITERFFPFILGRKKRRFER